MKKKNATRLGTLCCVGGAVSWGFSGACSEALFKGYAVPPAWLTSLRMFGAGVILLVFLALRRGRAVLAPFHDRQGLGQLTLFSLCGLLFCQLAYLSGIRWSNSGTATVLQNLCIVFVALYVSLSTRTRPSPRLLLCITLALAGVWLIATGGHPGSLKLSPQGLFWGVAAGLGGASYTLLSRRPVQRFGSLMATGWGMLLGGTLLVVILRAWRLPAGLDGRAALLLGFIVVMGTVVSFSLFLKGVQLAGPLKAALLGCLEPLTAAALSALWLGSRFDAADGVGFALILTTVFLLRD